MIETPRLILRELRDDDLDELARLFLDQEVVRFIGNGTPPGRKDSEAWFQSALAHWAEHGFGTYSVRLRTTGEFVGRAGLTVQELEHGREVEVSYVLAAAHWHQGYATEAAVAVRDHAVQELGLRRLVALIDADNEASKRVAAKLGMVYEREVKLGSRWRELGRMFELFAMDGGDQSVHP
jgi:RimJ/RimL family protein N-acetyltransferase